MSTAAAAIAVIVFALVLKRLGARTSALEVFRITDRTWAVLGDKSLSEHAKEAAARRAALATLRHGGMLILQIAVALALSAVVAVAVVLTGYASEASLEAAFLSWPILLLAVATFAYEILRKT